jgi:peptidoglycan/xylan/chitin deacetylase (PgdA/CDA1 family)
VTNPVAGNGGEERQRFAETLDQAAARGMKIRFWWRDDDAVDVTPSLEKLLAVSQKYEVPLALAVVPKQATAALAKRLEKEPNVSVLQHGWRHRNHAPDGDKQVELGNHRPADEILGELRLGFDRLTELFPTSFLPVLVPPWNRIADGVRKRSNEIGLTRLSTFGPAPADDPHWINVHLDIIEWRPVQRPVEPGAAYAVLVTEMKRRLAGDPEPIGIMTHHLVHEGANWAFLDDLFRLIAKHPAVGWSPHPALFDLAKEAVR